MTPDLTAQLAELGDRLIVGLGLLAAGILVLMVVAAARGQR